MSKTATNPARIEKAAGLIDQVKYTGQLGMISQSFEVKAYKIRLYDEPNGWTCSCEWGRRHAYEANNECSHALAARYYASDHDIDLGAFEDDSHLDDIDPFDGL